MHRDFPMTAFMNQSKPIESEEKDPSNLTCNAIQNENHILFEGDGSLDYDNLQFEDLLGNPIDGRTCDVIYADDYNGPVQLLVDPDGSVQYIWVPKNADELRESPVTSAETHFPTTAPARPAGIMSSGLAESTSLNYDAAVSHITAPPHSATIEHRLRHRLH